MPEDKPQNPSIFVYRSKDQLLYNPSTIIMRFTYRIELIIMQLVFQVLVANKEKKSSCKDPINHSETKRSDDWKPVWFIFDCFSVQNWKKIEKIHRCFLVPFLTSDSITKI